MTAWEYIADELAERGWSEVDLAERMGGPTDKNLVVLGYLKVLGNDPKFTMGAEVAGGIAHAFGTSAELWLNLDDEARGRTT